jgi:hypothetical protein
MNDAALVRIERMSYLFGGLLVAVCWLFLPREQALGALVGALIGCINFSLIRGIVTRWISRTATAASSAEPARGSASGFFLIPKMAGLLVAIFLALRFLPLSPPFLAVGFSVFMLSIAVETVRGAFGPADDELTGSAPPDRPARGGSAAATVEEDMG